MIMMTFLGKMSGLRRILIAVTALGATGAGAVIGLRGGSAPAPSLNSGGHVKRLSGNTIKLRDGRAVEFAGLRLPYDDEPYAAESRRTLDKWLHDEGVRLQFDEAATTRKGALLAYVYANDTFINERLLRDGLAFAKLRAGNRQRAETFLKAQADAQAAHKGIWRTLVPTHEGRYLGVPESASFHTVGCPDIARRAGLVEFTGSADAFASGYAPCGHCKPCSADAGP